MKIINELYSKNVYQAVERFSSNTKEISITLQDAIVQWQSSTLPNDVETTTILIEEHSREQQELKDDLQSAIRHGETLLSCIRRPSEEDASLDLCPDKLINVATVERYIFYLENNAHDSILQSKSFNCISLLLNVLYTVCHSCYMPTVLSKRYRNMILIFF